MMLSHKRGGGGGVVKKWGMMTRGGGGGQHTPQKWWRHLWTAPYLENLCDLITLLLCGSLAGWCWSWTLSWEMHFAFFLSNFPLGSSSCGKEKRETLLRVDRGERPKLAYCWTHIFSSEKHFVDNHWNIYISMIAINYIHCSHPNSTSSLSFWPFC